MSNPELLVRLRSLHDDLVGMNGELTSADEVDTDTIEALGQLVTDVGGLVDRANATQDAAHDADPETHAVLDRIMQFESTHPRVTQFLSQVTDVLVVLGI